MATLWLLWSLLGTSLAAPLSGLAEPSGIIGRRELRRPALFLEAQHLGHGATPRQPGVIFKTLSNFGGRRRLTAPAGSVEATPAVVITTEGGSDDAITSLINRFGGVIHQKRRLGDGDVVTDGSDELIARPSGAKLNSGGNGKPPGSDEGEAWRPTYGGGYRKEPELQSNYEVLLSEPDFGPAGPLRHSYADVLKTSAALPQAPPAGSEPTDVPHVEKASGGENKSPDDCKDKNAEKNSTTGAGDNVLDVKSQVSSGNTAPTTPETAGQQSVGANDAVVTTEPEPEEGEEDYDDDDYEDDEEQSEFGDSEKNNLTTVPAPGQETTVKSQESESGDHTDVQKLDLDTTKVGAVTAGSRLEEEASIKEVTDSTTATELNTVTSVTLSRYPDSPNLATGSLQRGDQTETTVQSPTLLGESPSTVVAQDKSNFGVSFETVPPQLPASLPPSRTEFVTPASGATSSSTESIAFAGKQKVGDTGIQKPKAENSAEKAPDGASRLNLENSAGVALMNGYTATFGIDAQQRPKDTSVQAEKTLAAVDSTVLEERSGSVDSSVTSPVPEGARRIEESPGQFNEDTTRSTSAERGDDPADGTGSSPTESAILYPSETAIRQPPPPPVTPMTNPVTGRKPGRGDVNMNGVSREAAEEEILNYFKERGQIQSGLRTALKDSDTHDTTTAGMLGTEGGGVESESLNLKSGSTTSRNSQNVNYQSENVNPRLPSSGVASQNYPILPQLNLPAASLQEKAIQGAAGRTYGRGTLTVSSFPGYGIPTSTGVLYPVDASTGHLLSERVFAQGSLPASSAGFVADATLAAAPANDSENAATAVGTPLLNGGNENSPGKSENTTVSAGETAKTSSDAETSKTASSLEAPSAMGEGTEHNVEDGSSTSFFAGSDSVSTAKDKNLAVDNMETGVNGGLGRLGFEGNSNVVPDKPIDVSGILTTPSEKDSSSALPKQSTIITDSTKALIVEDEGHGMPIDVSGIATSSEITTEDSTEPSTGDSESVDVGKDRVEPTSNTNEQTPPAVAANTKTNEDCKDQDVTADMGGSPHGKPVVFGSAPISASGQAPTGGANELTETSQERNLVTSSNGSNSVQRDAPAIQSEQPSPVRGTQVSLTTDLENSEGPDTVQSSEAQPQGESEQSGAGFVVGTRIDVSDRDRAPPTSTPLPSITTTAVSFTGDRTTQADSVQSSSAGSTSQTTTPPTATMVDQKDNRELGGEDVPETPGNNSTRPGEKSIVVVLSQMFNDTNSSENVNATSQNITNSQDAKHTPLPISSVSISNVGHSTATLPALGYATVTEIQIASQQAVPSKQSDGVPPATSPSDYTDQVDSRSPKRSEVVEGSSYQNVAPQTVVVGDEARYPTTHNYAPKSELNPTVAPGNSFSVSDQLPETASTETPLSGGSIHHVPQTSTSYGSSTTQTALTQELSTEAPQHFAGEGAVTTQFPTESAIPPEGLVTDTAPKSVSVAGATEQLSTDSPPGTTSYPADITTRFLKDTGVTQQLLTETSAEGPIFSTEVPPSTSVTSGVTDTASLESTTGSPLNSETPSGFTGTKDTVPAAENTESTKAFGVLSADVSTSTLSPGVARDENSKETSTPASRELATQSTLPITSTPATTQTASSSTLPHQNVSSDVVPTTENPDVATVVSATESQRVDPGVTNSPNMADTTLASTTAPPPPYVKTPQVSTFHVPKRPLFPLRRPGTFVTAERNFKPADRHKNEDDQTTLPATSTVPPKVAKNDGDSTPLPGRENVVSGVVRPHGTRPRRPHFRRPTSGNRVHAPGENTGGRNTGRRRKPGRRPGHRRTTTVFPPQPEAHTTTPSSIDEDTTHGPSLTAPFGARIGARVTDTSFTRAQTAQKPPLPYEPVAVNREHSRPSHTRRTKRPKVPHATQTAATEDNNVRYSYNTHNFVGTRSPAVTETTYEPTREAYITNIAPASTTYRTKSGLVAEVTLPSTQETDTKIFSSVEYGEPLSDEPQLPSAQQSNYEAPVKPLLSSRGPSGPSPTFDEQQLLQDHGPQVTSQVAGAGLETTKTVEGKSEGVKNHDNEQNVSVESDQINQSPMPSDERTPTFSTMAPSTPYGTKLNVDLSPAEEVSSVSENVASEGTEAGLEGTGPVVLDEVTNDSGKAVSEGADGEDLNSVTPSRKFYPGRYRPQHTTTYATTETPAEATTRLTTNGPASEATISTSRSEEPFPSTPELDISRLQTTTLKPVEATPVPTTKKPLFPPLPDQPTNPVAVFLVPTEQAQNEGAEHDQLQKTAPAEKQRIQTVTTTRPPTTVTTRRTETPQLTSNKQTEVNLPPSFLISSSARQPATPQYGTNIPPVYVTQYAAPKIQPPGTVVSSESDPAIGAGTRGSVINTDDSKDSAVAGATSSQSPYVNQRPEPGSVSSVKLQASVGSTAQRPDRVPTPPPASVQSQSVRPTLQPDTSASLAPQKQPNVGTSQYPGTVRPAQAQTASPSSSLPLAPTGRPRLPPAYSPPPAFLEPLGIQVRQPNVIQGQTRPPSSAAAARAPEQPLYLQSLGLQLANYQSAKAQKPSAAPDAQTSGGYVQPLGLQLTEAPKPQRQHSSTTGSSPSLGAALSIAGQQDQRLLGSGVKSGGNSQYLLPLGLQVAYLPPEQRQPASIPAGRLPSRPSELRPQQGSAPAAFGRQTPNDPKYSVVSSPPRPSAAGQPAGRIRSGGVNQPGAPVYLTPQVAVLQGNTKSVPGTNRVISSGLAQKYPASIQSGRKPSSVPFHPGHSQPVGSISNSQQRRPYGTPQAQNGQRPHIGQARTRIFFSPPTPVKEDGSKNPRLPVSPFFLSIRHDQVIQEDAALPQVGTSLLQKQRIPADVLLPLQKTPVQANGRPATTKTNAGYEPLLQVPQTPKPARVQPQQPFSVAKVATGYKPLSPANYAVPTLPQGVARQVILSPATGPIPYQTQTIASANKKARQQGTQGVYNVRTYVPLASASLPGRPGFTATSYVPATQNGQDIKVTSVSRPSHSPTSHVTVQNVARGSVQAKNAESSGVLTRAGQPASVTPRQPSGASGPARIAQGVRSGPVYLAQGLVQVPQQVYQVGSYAPRQAPQGRTFVSQVPAQQTYQRGQPSSFGYQGPVVYASAPGAPVPVQYQPTAGGVVGQIRQYLPQQLQAIYGAPQGYRVVQANGGTSAGRPGQANYSTGVRPSLYQALPPGAAVQSYAPVAHARPPATLVGRVPVYAYQSPVYTYQAATPQRVTRGATNQSRPPAAVGIR